MSQNVLTQDDRHFWFLFLYFFFQIIYVHWYWVWFIMSSNFNFDSFILSGYFYSTSSSPLLLRGAPDCSIDTARRSATGDYKWRTCPRHLRAGLTISHYHLWLELFIQKPLPKHILSTFIPLILLASSSLTRPATILVLIFNLHICTLNEYWLIDCGG